MSQTERTILIKFARHTRLSRSECKTWLIEEYKRIADKNVRKSIAELVQLRLLEPSPLGEEGSFSQTKRNTEYLCVSPFGMYYLFKMLGPYGLAKQILKHNLENKLFQIFLYPYISKGTILELKNTEVIRIIFNFLQTILDHFDETFSILETIESIGGVHPYKDFILQKSKTTDKYEGLKELLEILEIDFNIKWKDNSKVRLIVSGNNILKITDEKKEILIMLDTKDNSAKILEDGYTLCKLGHKKIGNTYEFMLNRQTNVEEWLRTDDEYVDSKLVRNLCLDIIDNYNGRASTEQELEKNRDILLIANDLKFKYLIKNMEVEMRSRYANYLTLSDL